MKITTQDIAFTAIIAALYAVLTNRNINIGMF